MRFAHIHIIHFIWLLLPLGLLFWWLRLRKSKIISRFVDEHLWDEVVATFSLRRQKIKNALLLGVILFSIIALARPQWGFKWREIKRQGLDVLLAIDTSKSMLANDVKPNRLERTKLAVKDLLKKLKGDRIGLVAFSGDAFLTCPLTVDYGGFLLSLEMLDTETIPRGGTSIAKAIDHAIKGYESTPNQYKAIVIITDGENLEGDPLEAAKKAKEKGVKIYCVGIGTAEGDLIQIRNDQGELEFLKDKGGNFIKSRLNEKMLQEIAFITGGAYVRSSGAQFGLDVIYEQYLSKMEKREIESKMKKMHLERFQLPLAIALLLLILEVCVTTRKALAALIFIVFVLNVPTHALASSKVKDVNKGNEYYSEGKYQDSIEMYQKALEKDGQSDIINFNLGAALYKTEDFDQAITHFQKALLSETEDLKLKTHYNMGNAFYKGGIGRVDKDIKLAISMLQEALPHYEHVINAQENNEDAQNNYEFVKKELELLKQQQTKSKQCPFPKKDKSDKQSEDSQKDNSQSEGQDENQPESKQQQQQKQQDQNGQQGQQQQQQSASDQEDPEESKDDASSMNQDDDKQDEQDKQENSAAGVSDPGKMSEEEAKMLLEKYEQNEEPKGLINFIPRSSKQPQVLKDW